MHVVSGFFGKFYFGVVVSIAFVLWIEISPASFRIPEDSFIENLSCLFFFIASIGLFTVAWKSSYLKEKNSRSAYFMIIAWALLMFVFAGEEISWGQRIFSFSTPESLEKINGQQEFNVHNIYAVDTVLGGKYRYLSVMILLTGVVFPLLGYTDIGKKLFQKFSYPICPIQYLPLFLGSYLFGKYYVAWNPPYFDGVLAINDLNSPTEVREFLFGLGMMCFALYGARYPNKLFLVNDVTRGAEKTNN